MHVFIIAAKLLTSIVKNTMVFITFGGSEFSHRFKIITPLRPFAHFFGNCKNRWEVFKKRKTEKISKRLESETNFMKIENRGIKNTYVFNDFMLRFGRRRAILELQFHTFE